MLTRTIPSVAGSVVTAIVVPLIPSVTVMFTSAFHLGTFMVVLSSVLVLFPST